MVESEPDFELFQKGRAAFDGGDYELAISLFRQSLEISLHFKTLELLGEALCRLGKHRESIIPLAAATALNRGSKAPCLLAEAFVALKDWASAKDAAIESLRRTPEYGRANAILGKVADQLTIG